MRTWIVVFISFFILSLKTEAQFVVEFESAPNRRPPQSLTAQIDGYRELLDINLNGSPDMLYGKWNDSILCFVDGLTREAILYAPIEPGVNRFVADNFVDVPNNPYAVSHIVSYSLNKTSPKISIYDIKTQSISTFNKYLFIGLADFDSGGKTEILAYNLNTHQCIILGYQNADFKPHEPEFLPNNEPQGLPYTLELLYESDRRRFTSKQREPLEALFKYDFNRDGEPELVMFIEDDSSNIEGMTVLNPKTQNQVWSFAFPAEHLEELQSSFHGFYDTNGDNEPELLFGKNTVVTLDKQVHQIDPDFEIVTIKDIDGDGYEEVIGKGKRDSTVQIWGKASSPTSIQENTEKNIFKLNNSPNPFSGQTTIRFTIEKSSSVRLDIFDINGRLIETPILDQLSNGNHEYIWQPRQSEYLATIYIYQLTVDGNSIARKMILIN